MGKKHLKEKFAKRQGIVEMVSISADMLKAYGAKYIDSISHLETKKQQKA